MTLNQSTILNSSPVWVVGDIHMRPEYVALVDKKAIEAGVQLVIQVGDFGILWPESKDNIYGDWGMANYFKHNPGPTWLTIGGNHDPWPVWLELQRQSENQSLVQLVDRCYFVPRSTILTINDKKLLLLGGANSIDRHCRVDGESWWAEEEPTKEEINQFFNLMEEDHPEIVITHEVPSPLHISNNKRHTNVAVDLENVRKMSSYRPRQWYYGHHHHMDREMLGGTEFICCGQHGEFQILE